MRTQNFILSELLEDRIECAKIIADSSEILAFRDYFIALAHSFEFGNQNSYIVAYDALWKFSYEGGSCYSKVRDVLGTLNHVDCGAHYLLSTFVLLETENDIFLDTVGEPFKHDQTHHIYLGGLQLTTTGLISMFKNNRDKYGPPRSLLIDEEYINTYITNVWKIYNVFSYRIVKTAELNRGDKFVIFGNTVGSTENDYSFWRNSKFNEYGQDMLDIYRPYLIKHYYSKRELEDDEYLGNSPESYCEARLFIFDLIFEGTFPTKEMHSSKPYRNCVKYHKSKWG